MKHHILILLAALLLCAGNLSAQTLLGDPPETADERQARLIIESVESSKSAFLGELRHNFKLLWDYPNPQGVLDAMQVKQPGSPAKLFGIHSRLTQFIATELTLANDLATFAELQSLATAIPPHEINEDGTVTILPVEGEAPSEP
jgi:hypothetical protein